MKFEKSRLSLRYHKDADHKTDWTLLMNGSISGEIPEKPRYKLTKAEKVIKDYPFAEKKTPSKKKKL